MLLYSIPEGYEKIKIEKNFLVSFDIPLFLFLITSYILYNVIDKYNTIEMNSCFSLEHL